MDKLLKLRQALGKAIDDLNTDAIIGDETLYKAKEAEIADLRGQIDRMERAQKASADLARPVNVGGGAAGSAQEEASFDAVGAVAVAQRAQRSWTDRDYVREARAAVGFQFNGETHFRSLGEQLLAIVAHYNPETRSTDPRLVRAPQTSIRAPSGAAVMDPTSGGFLVQTDFATAIFARAYALGEVLSRTQKLTISTDANGIKIPGIDETSRATGSRWGGVQSNWVGEGTTVAATKPKFRLIELDLKKLMSSMYVTDEMLRDASVLTTIAMQAFSEEITFMVEDSIFRGTGAGMPLGFLNAQAKVTVPKETGQAAGTLVYENVLNMWSRMWGRSRSNAIWTINQDVEPQLYSLSQVIGTAGVPVYLPPNGISGNPYGVLFGRPVIPVEYADTLGNEGDISLIDLSQYVLADKGGVQAASSMHAAFLTDEMVFRITYRVDGEPIWHAPLTPYKGTKTQTPFVTLASR
ncbi:phage major capsid protein [Xanthobacter sp.]|uniref:phage major capsid protein n=1 Tax=Xanthobacter sp. TaxID=35809 RepID=UPI0025F6312A|nr:phage major capsid protein [Xanthobacter sp.]